MEVTPDERAGQETEEQRGLREARATELRVEAHGARVEDRGEASGPVDRADEGGDPGELAPQPRCRRRPPRVE